MGRSSESGYLMVSIVCRLGGGSIPRDECLVDESMGNDDPAIENKSGILDAKQSPLHLETG